MSESKENNNLENNNKRKRDLNDEEYKESLNITSINEINSIPSSIISLFITQDGTRTGPPIEIPLTSTTKQLDVLINTLLENNEPVSYSFLLSSSFFFSFFFFYLF